MVIFGIQENAKYFNGKQDLTATREARFTNIWTGDAGFLPFRREFGKSSGTKMYFPVGKKKSLFLAATGESFSASKPVPSFSVQRSKEIKGK